MKKGSVKISEIFELLWVRSFLHPVPIKLWWSWPTDSLSPKRGWYVNERTLFVDVAKEVCTTLWIITWYVNVLSSFLSRNPNNPIPLRHSWPKYTADQGQYLALRPNITVKIKMRPEKMALWNTYLPNINQTVVEQLPAETTSLPPQPCTINTCGPGKCSLNSRELKQRRRQRPRKRHSGLKSEFALPQTLSPLFHLV